MELDLSALGPAGLLAAAIYVLARALEYVLKNPKSRPTNGLAPVLQKDLTFITDTLRADIDRIEKQHDDLGAIVAGMQRTIGRLEGRSTGGKD